MRRGTAAQIHRAVLAAWIAAAVALAAYRVPYDDEWFTLGLALEADWSTFWDLLGADRHPPWVALLDRLMVAVWPSQMALSAWRVAAAAVAIVLYGSAWSRATGRGRLFVAVAAFHPVVLMYGGALRWYPLLLLAQGLRAWALWGARGPRARTGAFAAGAMLGSAASYLDAPFLLLDAAWLSGVALRGRPGGWRGTAPAVGAGLGAALLTWLASPLGPAHGLAWARWGSGFPQTATALLTWAALGPAGEAHPSYPTLLLGVLPFVAMAAGWYSLCRDSRSRAFAAWALSVTGLWAFCAPVAVWHPRYSLSVWLLGTAASLQLLRRSRVERLLTIGAGGYLAAALALTVVGRSMVKADLNGLTDAACEALLRGRPEVVVAPYQRVAALIVRSCAPRVAVVDVSALEYPRRERAQLNRVAQAVRRNARVSVVTLARASSSLALVERRVRSLVARQCELQRRAAVAPVPHADLKRRLGRPVPSRRLIVEDWRCGHR